MNDRELLEAAAKSVDLVFDGYTENFFDPEEWLSTGLVVQSESGVSCYLWNPLLDDADAFRLMCDLKMKIVCLGPRDAIRRAIVTVAADMGRKKDD